MMADGDPMEFETRHGGDVSADSNWISLLFNGAFDYWSNTSAMADGWGWTKGGVGPTESHSRQGGTRTGGVGDYYQRTVVNASGAGTLGWLQQSIDLPGNAGLDGNGHHGETAHFKIWVREASGGAACTFTIALRFFNAAGTVVSTAVSGTLTPTSSWQSFTVDGAVSHVDTVRMDVFLTFTVTGAGTVDLWFDDAYLYFDYTCNKNPTIPDAQKLVYPRQRFTRNVSAALRSHRPGGVEAKHQKVLRFGAVNLVQFKKLRHIYLLDCGLQLKPYHPHLPTVMPVRIINDFDFALVQHIAPDLYHGTIILEEI